MNNSSGVLRFTGQRRQRRNNENKFGMDVLVIRQATERAVEFVRAESVPFLLVAQTYRFCAHSMYDPEIYPSKEEIEKWKMRCPVANFEARLRKKGFLNVSNFTDIEDQVSKEIDEAAAFAEAGEFEPVEDLMKDVYTSMR